MTFSCMNKKETKKQSDKDKDTLAEVTKEMAKPRLAMSAREHSHILRDDLLRNELVKN
jgi:hypothetical protein